MKKNGKRFFAWILAMTLIVTSAQWNIKQAKALDLSGIDVTVNVAKNGAEGYDALKQATIAETITIDNVTYNNYNKYEGLTVTATSEKDAASKAIDGSTSSRWESDHGVDPQEVLVDFGCVYSLKNIKIYWETASSKTYEVLVSEDGNTFEKLTDVESENGDRVDDITLSSQIEVRAVKLNCTSRTTTYGHSIYEMAFYGASEQGKVVPVLSNLKIRDYYKYTGKYMIYFTEPEDVEEYNVYLDDSDTPIKTIDSSGSFLDAEDLKGVSAGEHTLSIASVDSAGEESAKVSKTFIVGETAGTYNDIAQIYIYTPVAISQEYHDNKDVTVTVIDENGEIDTVDTSSNIKIRGNTTAGAPKKPWNIKLDKKKSILGMPKGKKWCILANSFDKSLMRNKLSYEMGLANGLDYNCESRFVEVYVNGTYNGNYLITEPVETGDGRVEIDPYNADNMDILLELGTRNEAGVDHFYTTTEVFDVNEPEKGDDLTDAEVDAKIARVKTYLSEFEGALKGDDYNAILEYIDEDSFVDFYIVNELFKNVDFDFSSTRFHINDDTIFAGPMWDLDLSSGNCKSSYYTNYYVDGVSWKGYYCQGMGWYKELFKKDEFYSKVKARYAELQYVIQNIYKAGSTQENSIDQLINIYGASFERNFMSTNLLGAGWSLTNDDGYSFAAESGWKTWEEPIEFLRNWLANRNTWLCEQWGVDMQAAYEEGKNAAEEPTTEPPTTEEPTTVEPTTEPVPENTVAAFNYYGFNATAGDDITEYAYENNDYTYKATTGTGTMMGSVNGTALKHIEWGSADDYGVMVPVMPASSKNLWTADAYVSYTFSTAGYAELKSSVEVGGTKKGPRDLAVGYYEGEKFVTLAEYTIPKNKTMYEIEFELPETLENQESVTVYIKLTSTTNIGGNEMTSIDYSSGGELAFNNFIVTYDSEIESTGGDETTSAPVETTTVVPETTTVVPETTTEPVETTTAKPVETTTAKPVETTTTKPVETTTVELETTTEPLETTTVAPTTKVKKPAKAKIKKANVKKISDKKVKISLKKIKGAVGYQIAIYKTKKNAKKNKKALVKKTVKKRKFTIKSKKLKNKKKLFVKVRAYVLNANGKKVYGKWSKIKTVKKAKK